MTIPGTLACERIKTPERAVCACGWSVPVTSQRRAKVAHHLHLRWVKRSLQGAA